MRIVAKRHNNQFFLPTTTSVKINLKLLLLILFVILVAVQYFLVYPFLSNHDKNSGGGDYDEIILRRQEQLEKYRHVINNDNNNNVTVFFVHVGKSGGETIKWRLRVICNLRASARKRAMCHEQFQNSAASSVGGESEVSKHTIGYMHCNSIRPKGSIYESSILMYSIRDPIDRVVSWFQYMHPKNCLRNRPSAACNLKLDKTLYNAHLNYTWGYVLFDVCFPTINDMIQSLQQEKLVNIDGNSNSNINCSQMAIDTITGYGPPGPSNHLYFNYHYYVNKTYTLLLQSSSSSPYSQKPKKKPIFVIRKENLFDDLRSIEYLLGGNIQRPFEMEGGGDKTQVLSHHGNQFYPYKASLDSNLMPILCCTIPKELTIYVTLVTRALNLLDADKIASVEELYTKCDVSKNNPIPNNKNPVDTVAQSFLSQLSQKCHWDDKSATLVSIP